MHFISFLRLWTRQWQ